MTLNVDEEHLQEAFTYLDTDSITEAINRSLDETVRLMKRRRLVERDLDLTPEKLREIRQPRFP
ncbi:MAG: hypothetical protein ACR2JV_01015 [Gaiellales bacterium]